MTKERIRAAKKAKALAIASRCREKDVASATWVKVAIDGQFKKRKP